MANNTYIQTDVSFHPGEDLEEKLQEMQMSVEDFAKASKVPLNIVEDIINGEASISADIAIAFEQVTGIPATMWIKMQHHYDDYILSQKRSSYLERLLNLSHNVAAVL